MSSLPLTTTHVLLMLADTAETLQRSWGLLRVTLHPSPWCRSPSVTQSLPTITSRPLRLKKSRTTVQKSHLERFSPLRLCTWIVLFTCWYVGKRYPGDFTNFESSVTPLTLVGFQQFFFFYRLYTFSGWTWSQWSLVRLDNSILNVVLTL